MSADSPNKNMSVRLTNHRHVLIQCPMCYSYYFWQPHRRSITKEFGYRLFDKFKPGDLVLLRNSSIEDSLNRKVLQRYHGPFQITYGIGEGENQRHSYIIQEMDGTIRKSLIATQRLIPYRPREIYEDIEI